MLAREHHFYTPEEYLALEEKAEYRSEYYQGQIIAMAGGSLNHNRAAGNIHTTLNNAFTTKPCEAFIGDVRLWIEKANRFTYPDVMVVCGEPEFFEGRIDTITNPKAIIEILSKSTESDDRSDKFHAYWTLDTFEEYVLVDQYRVHVEYFRRVSEKQWELQVFTKMSDTLTLRSIEVEISLDEIYHNVTWDE